MIDKSILKFWEETSDSEWYKSYRTEEQIKKVVNDPSSAFHVKTWEVINTYIKDFKNIKICVPSSGDNRAAFAFACLGAKVTSCDISKRQLENAEIVSRNYQWDIEFIVDDTMTLEHIETGMYDFVYTSNGVHVWINDLNSMYKNISRILKNDGIYIMYDIHPSGRPFELYDSKLTVVKAYGDVECKDSDGIHNYHWRMQDLINAMVNNNLKINCMEEMFAEYGTYWFEENNERDKLSNEEIDKLYNWKTNPMAALPQWLTVCCRKWA